MNRTTTALIASVILAFPFLGGSVRAAVLRGQWEFDSETNSALATVGSNLVYSGIAPSWSASATDDVGLAMSGVITTVWGSTNRVLAPHGIPANGGGAWVNQASWVMDILTPTNSRGKYRTIFQTNVGNSNDADYFINTADRIGITEIGYSTSAVNATVWMRLVITMDLTLPGEDLKSYVNGSLFYAHPIDQAVDGRFSLYAGATGVLMFSDQDGENYPLQVAGLAIYDGVLSRAEVASLGGPGGSMVTSYTNLPPSVARGPDGPAAITGGVAAAYSFVATDPESDTVQVQADWGNGTTSAWSRLGPSGIAQQLTNTWVAPGTFTILARGRDIAGQISGWITGQTITVSSPEGIPTGLAGLWEFDQASNLMHATYGLDLALAGTAPSFAASFADGQANSLVLTGVITTVQGAANRLLATHALGASGGGTRVNQYTLLFDFLVPGSGLWRTFYQTATANGNDAEYFVRNSDSHLGRSSIGYSSAALSTNRWYRLALSVDLTTNGFYRSYIDGSLFYAHSRPALDSDFSLEPGRVLLFGDNDGENHPLTIGMAAIFNRALDASEIAALGGAGIAVIPRSGNQDPSVLAQPAGSATGSTVTAESYAFVASDPDGDSVQVQADWGDVSPGDWSGFFTSGSTVTLSHVWSAPGSVALRARARDTQGGVSPWVDIQSVTVTGTVQVTFSTPCYLQNMSASGMVVMAEVVQDVALKLQYGSTTNYGSEAPFSSVASGGGTYFMRAVLEGLGAGVAYHYRVASLAGDPLTEDATFRTAPSRWEDFSFAALGDIQTSNNGAWTADPWEPTKTALQHMVDHGARFLVGLGDHANDGNNYSLAKSSHLNRTAAILGAHVPFYIAWGNHDQATTNSPLRLSADMPSRYRPGFSPGHGSYSFTYSGVFFICLDWYYSSSEITNGWLDAQLGSPEARDARFRVVAVHSPPYCERWLDGDATLRATLVPRLEQYHVNLCLSGHTHEYERGETNGVNYVVAGGGSYLDTPEVIVKDWACMTVGGAQNVAGTYATQSAAGVLGTPQPIVGGLFHHYIMITVRDRYLRLDCHGFNADGSYIGVLDSLEIGQDPGPDSDGDGMRDSWQHDHSLTGGTEEDGPDGDPDHDGMSNLQEFWAGTDPRVADSRMMIQSLIRPNTSTGAWGLAWSSAPGCLYGVYSSKSLQSWDPIDIEPWTGGYIHADTGAATTVELPNSPTNALFWRVQLHVP